jgi:hypothetical protein
MYLRKPQPRCLRKPAGILLTGLLLITAGGCDTPDDMDRKAPEPDRHISQERPPAPVTSLPATGKATIPADTLAPGTFDIRQDAGRLTIRANAARRGDILDQLAVLAGFEVAGPGASPDPVTLAIETTDLHAALVELLKPRPFQIIYEYDRTHDRDVLARVVAGQLPAAPGTAPAQPVPPLASDWVEGAPLPDAADRGLSVEDQILLNQLLDPSAEVRTDAAERIEATGIALDYLARIITTDPSPDVRIAASYSLENSEDPHAFDTLILGLNDADPEVLATVIDSLAFLDDRRAIPYLQPLLTHPDEDVRDAAESAIDSLQ